MSPPVAIGLRFFPVVALLLLAACGGGSSTSSPPLGTVDPSLSSAAVQRDFAPNTTFALTVNDAGGSTITFSVTSTAVVSLQSSAVTTNPRAILKVESVGSSTFTAVVNTISLAARITISRGEQSAFRFGSSQLVRMFTSPSITVRNPATGGSGDGAIRYSISPTAGAAIDASGTVTVSTAGVFVITAVKEGQALYRAISATYIFIASSRTLMVQTTPVFTLSSLTLTYAPGLTTRNVATGGMGTGGVQYSIDDSAVATISSTSGQLVVVGVGMATVQVVRLGDIDYLQSPTATYVLTVDRAGQLPLAFARPSVTATFSPPFAAVQNPASGGSGSGAIRYSVAPVTGASVDGNGRVTVSQPGTYRVFAEKAGDANYLPGARIDYVLTVTGDGGPPVTGPVGLGVRPLYPHTVVDISVDNPPANTPYTYTITDIRRNTVSGMGDTGSASRLLVRSTVTNLVDGTLTISFDAGVSVADVQVVKDSRRDRRVALLFFHAQGTAPSFTTATMSSRFANNSSNNASALLQAVSLGKERFGRVDTFGFYPVEANTFDRAVSSIRGAEYWQENTGVIAAVRSGALNPENYDIIYAVYDSTTGVVSGDTVARRVPVSIDNTTYTERAVIALYGDARSFFSDQPFANREEFSSSIPIIRSTESTFLEVDGVIVHEYIHTKGIDQHALFLGCDHATDSFGGICKAESFNPYDVIGSSRRFAQALNPFAQARSGWTDARSQRIISAIPPGSNTTRNYRITLLPDSSTSGVNTLRIDFQGYWRYDLWLQNIAASRVNYALYDSSFSNTVDGLLVHRDGLLVDASPPAASFTTGTNEIGSHDSLSISRTADGFVSRPLGVYVSNVVPNSVDQSISFDLRLTEIVPAHRIPSAPFVPCVGGVPACSVARGGAVANTYSFLPDDVGYPRETPSWTVEFVGVPAYITASHTTISTTLPGGGTIAVPSADIVYRVSAGAPAGNSTFTIRVCNSNDRSACRDLRQVLMIR